jgi:protocatechuate 3,4-dioxygenase, beta subunit
MSSLAPLTPATQPPYDVPSYRATALRAPREALVRPPTAHAEYAPLRLPPADAIADLSTTDGRAALGERIVVEGRVSDDGSRPLAGVVIELWQANAAGRYAHASDAQDIPLDPNFRGTGRVVTDGDGHYRFITIMPGAYPWDNHPNAWRPRHIHFSLLGPYWRSRLVTQMYFPGDPLLELDPIFQSIPDAGARARLVSARDLAHSEPGRALGYRFDLVLRGAHATPRDRP